MKRFGLRQTFSEAVQTNILANFSCEGFGVNWGAKPSAVKNNPLQDLLRSVPAPLRNKYILVLTLFFAWMIFIDKHDVLTQFKLQRTVKKLEQEKVLYSEQIKAAERERLDLEVNKEKIAREKYFMKKPGEDVFIIVDEEDQ